jgi:hypothetical protein
MIAEIVTFDHPPGATREQLIEGALQTVARWQANPDLQRKHYLCSLDRRQGMGFYLWPSIEAARAGHDAEWIAQTEARTGGKVHIAYYDLLMVLDNNTGTLTQPPASIPV